MQLYYSLSRSVIFSVFITWLQVLTEYSDRMKKLLEDPDKFYDPKKRPSGHDIGKGFGKNNNGAIPSNLLQIPNSESNGAYMSGCKEVGIKSHPARFPAKLPEFFIKFLTDPEDIVVDIFGGSNTTGFVAETERRNWYSFDMELEYVAASAFRFLDKGVGSSTVNKIYEAIRSGKSVDIEKYKKQLNMFKEEAAEYKAYKQVKNTRYHSLGNSGDSIAITRKPWIREQ